MVKVDFDGLEHALGAVELVPVDGGAGGMLAAASGDWLIIAVNISPAMIATAVPTAYGNRLVATTINGRRQYTKQTYVNSASQAVNFTLGVRQ